MRNSHRSFAVCVLTAFSFVLTANGRELTLDETIEFGLGRSTRSEIIEGDLEVAEQNYFARRVNFYVPEISINGSLPAYNVMESFRFFGGRDQKDLIKTTDLDFNANISLRQSLITGGDLSATGNMWNRSAKYPSGGYDIKEKSTQGVFDFKFEQPLLKRSDAKHDLNNTKDDLEIARLTLAEELAQLRKEITQAYFGVLLTSLQRQISGHKVESAHLKTSVDSIKHLEGVISEEAWLESASTRLDAELERFDAENQSLEKSRDLAILLDLDVTEEIIPSVPEMRSHLAENERASLISRWEDCVPIKKAGYEYSKARREADYVASAHGLTGSFSANYSLGRGDVEVDGQETNNDTDSWGVALNFSFPLWDGGSSGAAVKAARITAKKSELEYERAKRSARAEIVDLINRLDIGYRKLGVLRKQIELAKSKLEIARGRLEDGQISGIQYLDSEVSYLEAQDSYLEELAKYLIDKIELDSKYSS